MIIMSIPNILYNIPDIVGYRIGSIILAETVDFSRFDSLDKLLAYAGMSLYLPTLPRIQCYKEHFF